MLIEKTAPRFGAKHCLATILTFVWLTAVGHGDVLHGFNGQNIPIPEYPGPQACSDITFSSAPDGSEVTLVRVHYRIVHTYPGDLEIWATVYTNDWDDSTFHYQGDLPGDPDYVEETIDIVGDYDGISPNQQWFLCARDMASWDEGYIDFFEIWVYYTPPCPDLIVQDISISPTQPVAGDPVTITAIMCNQGPGDAPAFNIRYYIDGQPIGEDRVSFGLDPGECDPENTNHTVITPGYHTVRVCADVDNEVEECDETNNCREETYYWTAPDLIVQDISISPNQPVIHQTVTITAMLCNQQCDQGSAYASPFNIRYYIDGQPIGEDRVSFGLDPGECDPENTNHTVITPGYHTVRVCADVDNEVVECDETNNCREETFYWAPLTLYHDQAVDNSTTPEYFRYQQNQVRWAVIGVRPASGSDWDIRLYSDTLFQNEEANSLMGGSAVDFVVVDYRHAQRGWDAVKVNRDSGSGNCRLEYENGDHVITNGPLDFYWPANHIAHVWDIYLAANGHTRIYANPSPGLDIGLALFRSTNDYYLGRSSAFVQSDVDDEGGAEMLEFDAPATDWYGFVIWSNSATSGDIFIDGYVPVAEEKSNIPTEFVLCQAYPNPFNPTTTIDYGLAEGTHMTLDVYDLLGKKVVTLVDEYQEAGYHSVKWNAEGMPSGMYFYRVEAGEFTKTRKMLLLK